LQETLLHPSLSPYNKSFPIPPSLPGSPPDDPDPDHPKAEEGLLSGEGQRLRVTRKGASVKGGQSQIWIGGDWRGEGGIKAVRDPQFATTGALVSVDGVLQKPVDIGSFLCRHPLARNTTNAVPQP
jgi:hypothetical protein